MNYDDDFRAGIQRSMAEPAKKKDPYEDKFIPLNRLQYTWQTPKRYIPLRQQERRKRHLMRFWWNYNKVIGQFCWSMVFVFVAAEVILIYGIR